MIAAAGEGSIRDAESLFDQIAAFEGKITADAVERIVGKVGLSKIDAFAELLFKKDLDAALKTLRDLQETGHNLVQFTKDLIHYLRRVATLALAPSIALDLEKELTVDEFARIKKHASVVKGEVCVDILKRLLLAYQDMRYSPVAIIPLEVAVVEALQEKPESRMAG